MNKYLSILLPHSDDELFIFPFIESQINKGYLIKIFFLTYDNNPLREEESAKSFRAHKEIEVFQLGRLNSFVDGKLFESYDSALRILKENPVILGSESIICPIFEGGHLDHDELFKISYALALKLKKPLFCFSLYNAYQTPLVRVSTIFEGPVTGKREIISFSLRSGFSYVKKSFFYKSQLVILTVLLPGLLKTFLLKRRIEILRVEKFDPLIPHPGNLFYDNPLKKKIKKLLGM